ncbi:MAG: FkbM family methyltransferase [Gammaproteobacteria bacterium]|nr:MAG: FkbM family methyltransferase [Gammaproteobacteria bacterium]
MSFVSYAQNFEDVMLWRALKHVEKGFYIDVGANDPILDSVTKAFYEKGWRGINIEPVEQWFERLLEDRPRDINLNIAVGAEAGELNFYEIPDTGLSTTELAIAEHHEAESGYKAVERTVLMRTLAEVCQQYHLSPIHFLKIDVEGGEKKVLEGLDLNAVRPWIIVVESTLPNTQTEDYQCWEPILLGAGYDYVYFDGLNRFYIAKEQEKLRSAFTVPPNVFDEFIMSQQRDAELRATQSEAREVEVAAQLKAVRQELHEIHQSNHYHWQLAEARQQQIEALLKSKSWRFTAPLRWGRNAVGSIVPSALKPKVKLVLHHGVLYVNRRPGLKGVVRWMLNRFPSAKARLIGFVGKLGAEKYGSPPTAIDEALSLELAQLSPQAREIYMELKDAIEQRREGNG